MDFKYVFAGLRKLNRTYDDDDFSQPERSWDISAIATLLNRVACRLPVEPCNKKLARALHQIAAQLIDVSKHDHELDVPVAADLARRIRYAGERYD